MDQDRNTLEWVQHIAFELQDEKALTAAKKELEAKNIEVIGPTDHGIIKSFYFLIQMVTTSNSPVEPEQKPSSRNFLKSHQRC